VCSTSILGGMGTIGTSKEQGDGIEAWVLTDVVAVRASREVAYAILPALENDVEEIVTIVANFQTIERIPICAKRDEGIAPIYGVGPPTRR